MAFIVAVVFSAGLTFVNQDKVQASSYVRIWNMYRVFKKNPHRDYVMFNATLKKKCSEYKFKYKISGHKNWTTTKKSKDNTCDDMLRIYNGDKYLVVKAKGKINGKWTHWYTSKRNINKPDKVPTF